MSDDFELKLKQAFFEEAEQHLNGCEEAFMSFENGNASKEVINNILRLVHSFKGSAKTAGFEALSQFAHKFEDVMVKFKKDQIKASPELFTVLLEALDTMKTFIAGLRKDYSYTQDTKSTEDKLTDLITKTSSLSTPVESEICAGASELFQPSFPIIHDTPSTTSSNSAPTSNEKTTESQLSAAKISENENVRVATKKLDQLLNLVGELVVNQSMVTSHRLSGTIGSEYALSTLEYLDKVVHEVQDVSMSLRMVPAKPLFQKMRRTLRDISMLQNKQVEFVSEGEHVEVDRTILDKISDPLTHLIRNAIDHGIESKEERVALGIGKNPTATVTLSVVQQEDHIQIIVADDGRGIDKTKVLKKAIEKGIVSSTAQLSDQEAYALIFQSGFSTKEQVTDISGRGVGMDVVQRAIDDLKGSIQISTQIGLGTTFIFSLPLSLSVITGMVVEIDQKKYVIPISQLIETISYNKLKITTTTGATRMIDLRGEVIPVLSLGTLLHGSKKKEVKTLHKSGVVATYRGKKVSFEIDSIVGQQQIVLKKLGEEVRGIPGIIAGAILSSGEPGLILNLHDFIPEGGLIAV